MKTYLPSHDQLSAIAQSDPAQLEKLRKILIEEVIESAPEETRRRLRGLQFQIDCCRKLHTNPMGACVEISRMMYESLSKLNKLMNESTAADQNQSEPATVIAFPSAG